MKTTFNVLVFCFPFFRRLPHWNMILVTTFWLDEFVTLALSEIKDNALSRRSRNHSRLDLVTLSLFLSWSWWFSQSTASCPMDLYWADGIATNKSIYYSLLNAFQLRFIISCKTILRSLLQLELVTEKPMKCFIIWLN